MQKLKLDFKHSRYKIKPMWVLFWYRVNNAIYYSCIPNIIKKVLLIIFKLLSVLLVELPFSSEIPYKVKIGAGLRLAHPFGIFINEETEIEQNCTIFQSVTIGALDNKKNWGCPVIGDNVYIGAGAKILGNIKIGNNVNIGANAVVTKSVPDGCTVIGSNIIINKMHNDRRCFS